MVRPIDLTMVRTFLSDRPPPLKLRRTSRESFPVFFSVGPPRIELGLYAPHAHVLPLYYGPLLDFECIFIPDNQDLPVYLSSEALAKEDYSPKIRYPFMQSTTIIFTPQHPESSGLLRGYGPFSVYSLFSPVTTLPKFSSLLFSIWIIFLHIIEKLPSVISHCFVHC